MLDDVLDSIAPAITAIEPGTGEWTCLGIVGSRDDIDAVRVRLGPRFCVWAEPFDEDIAVAGGRPWIRGARTWEVWARFA